ncbi:uncharacterized protein wu:fj16a03 [Corythoichthys intestinalis]|uniref:uncharacterized protein wu:fj16a03 n=1 Tax=Corythoichthys intestinalis TaxID=161448 RepID=UPI0025A51BC0|nr:uncharacterized protein wu:fj16a03 [Corythoichthys intestinalis]
MKPFLLLLLLLPVFSAADSIRCYGEDHLLVRNMELTCDTSNQPQACYTRENGLKGCIDVALCSRSGFVCCNTELCNV